jgi:hypothetical protein
VSPARPEACPKPRTGRRSAVRVRSSSPPRRRQYGVPVRKAVLVVAALVALVSLAVAMRDKNCHFNIHLVKRVYCTEEE